MDAIVSYGVLNRLKYDLENKVLREWALKYGVVDTACIVESHRDVYLGGERVQWKSLSKNDKDILLKAVLWMRSNS